MPERVYSDGYQPCIVCDLPARDVKCTRCRDEYELGRQEWALLRECPEQPCTNCGRRTRRAGGLCNFCLLATTQKTNARGGKRKQVEQSHANIEDRVRLYGEAAEQGRSIPYRPIGEQTEGREVEGDGNGE